MAQAYICTNSIANLPLLKQPQNLYKFPALGCPSCKFACICMHFTSETTTLGPRTQPKNDSYMRQEPISPPHRALIVAQHECSLNVVRKCRHLRIPKHPLECREHPLRSSWLGFQVFEVEADEVVGIKRFALQFVQICMQIYGIACKFVRANLPLGSCKYRPGPSSPLKKCKWAGCGGRRVWALACSTLRLHLESSMRSMTIEARPAGS